MGKWSALECSTYPNFAVDSADLTLVEHSKRSTVRLQRKVEEDWQTAISHFEWKSLC
jgi:hypothetical protein